MKLLVPPGMPAIEICAHFGCAPHEWPGSRLTFLSRYDAARVASAVEYALRRLAGYTEPADPIAEYYGRCARKRKVAWDELTAARARGASADEIRLLEQVYEFEAYTGD